MTKYRGKYPTRINSVYSLTGQRGVVGVTLNNGERYTISAANVPDRMMPNVGTDISAYVAQKVQA